MTAYAIASLHPTAVLHEEVFQYMERVQATLDPFDGRFLIHGAPERDVKEGEWPASVVLVGFPSMDHARRWYDSAAYQELIPLRARHMAGDLQLIDGVAPGYDPATTAAALRVASDSTID